MTANLDDFTGLEGTGYSGGGSKPQIPPEEEFFHSVYIAGQTRDNHIQITEEAGKIQIRGVEYNLNEVNFVITHTKDILVKEVSKQGRQSTECFSYKSTPSPPWYGTTTVDGKPRVCPVNSQERSMSDFCNPCRSQIIVAGIYCSANGTPIKKDGKPIFVFIRGKGMKYKNVSDYLSDLYNEDLSPIFEPQTDQTKEFEKSVVNQKRFVTKLTAGKADSKWGKKDVFILERGPEIPKEGVINILKLSKQTLDNFIEKFDWSKRKPSVSGLGSSEGLMKMELDGDDDESSASSDSEPQQEAEEPKQDDGKVFSFDDVKF